MEVTNYKLEKEILKSKYEILVKQELNNIKFDTKINTKVTTFIFVNILMNLFFAWCSSSEESNLPLLLANTENRSIIFIITPIVFLLLVGGATIITVRNIVKKLNFQKDMTHLTWKQLYQKFILKKMGMESFDIEKIRNKYASAPDVVFDDVEFAEYIKKYYSDYKINVSFEFYNNLAKTILLDREIEGTLIYDSNQYTFIPKNNPEVFVMAGSI